MQVGSFLLAGTSSGGCTASRAVSILARPANQKTLLSAVLPQAVWRVVLTCAGLDTQEVGTENTRAGGEGRQVKPQ